MRVSPAARVTWHPFTAGYRTAQFAIRGDGDTDLDLADKECHGWDSKGRDGAYAAGWVRQVLQTWEDDFFPLRRGPPQSVFSMIDRKAALPFEIPP